MTEDYFAQVLSDGYKSLQELAFEPDFKAYFVRRPISRRDQSRATAIVLFLVDNSLYDQKPSEVAYFLPHEDGSPLSQKELKMAEKDSIAAMKTLGVTSVLFDYNIRSPLLPFTTDKRI